MAIKRKEKEKVLIISIIIVLILVLAISFAYFSTRLNGTDQIVKVGELELVLDETSEGISLENAIGLSDSEGLSLTPSTFKLINNGNKAVDYTIYLDDNTIGETDTRIEDKYLKYNLNKNGTDSGATLLTSIGTNPNRVLDSGTIEGGGTNTYSLNLWITDEVDGNYSGQVFSGKLRVEVSQARPLAVETLLAKVNAEDLDYNSATDEQKKEMWTFSHPATEQTEALTDYRYIGTNPNNYIMFNDELWRIIGVFTVDDGTGKQEERLKIIRNESIGNYSWDNKDTTTGAANEYGKNNWSDARLNYLLNEGHDDASAGGSLYWNSKSGMCYAGENNVTVRCDFTNKGLNQKARSMTDDAVWYLGDGDISSKMLPYMFYEMERQVVLNGNDSYWVGKVGLMYSSDYAYATSGGTSGDRIYCLYNSDQENFSSCSENDWLFNREHQWTISPVVSTTNVVRRITNVGSFSSFYARTTGSGIRPVVYLKANIKIIEGDGSSSNPYILAL